MTHNDLGGYRFLASPGSPYALGVAADDGLDIVHAVLTRPIPLDRGYELVRSHLEAEGRPPAALCGLELRIPEPFTAEGFAAFNRPYVETLAGWGLQIGGAVAVARTNVCPTDHSVSTPAVFAFSYTVREPALPGAYVLAGAAESNDAGSDPEARLRSIIDQLSSRLDELGCRWDRATAANFYADEGYEREVGAVLVPVFGGGAPTVQLTWVAALPPVNTLRFEVDVRRCGKEVVVEV